MGDTGAEPDAAAGGGDAETGDERATTGGTDIEGRAVVTGSEGGDEFGYEIAGGVLAWLGFIFTPLVTAVPAGYCALRVRETNLGAYYGILTVVAATCVFWILVVFAPEILGAVLAVVTGNALTLVAVLVPVVVLLVAGAGAVYVLWR